MLRAPRTRPAPRARPPVPTTRVPTAPERPARVPADLQADAVRGCRDDETWEYLAGDKGSDHVASEPDKVVKRCVNRQSDLESGPTRPRCSACGTIAYKNWGAQRGLCKSELNNHVGDEERR